MKEKIVAELDVLDHEEGAEGELVVVKDYKEFGGIVKVRVKDIKDQDQD